MESNFATLKTDMSSNFTYVYLIFNEYNDHILCKMGVTGLLTQRIQQIGSELNDYELKYNLALESKSTYYFKTSIDSILVEEFLHNKRRYDLDIPDFRDDTLVEKTEWFKISKKKIYLKTPETFSSIAMINPLSHKQKGGNRTRQ